MALAARPEQGQGPRFAGVLLAAGLGVIALGTILLLAALLFGAVGLMLGPLVVLVGLIAAAAGLAARRGARAA